MPDVNNTPGLLYLYLENAVLRGNFLALEEVYSALPRFPMHEVFRTAINLGRYDVLVWALTTKKIHLREWEFGVACCELKNNEAALSIFYQHRPK
jgi:hypothetical protein